MNAKDIILAQALNKGKRGMIIGWPAMLGVSGGGTATTVTGVSPLALALAMNGSLTSLTQTGKCAQASTPTPSAPVDIKCNNGAFKMVDDELPSGYKRVLGFSCNNNAMWQIAGFKLKGSDTVRISFSVSAACNVFGCYQGTDATDNYDLYASVSAGSKYFRYGNGTYLSYFSPENLNKRFDVVYTPTGSTGMPTDSTWTAKTFTSANDLLIGSTTTTGTSSKLVGNLYGDFIVDGRLHLVPCERVSDGVLGYYDTYSEAFYEPYTGFTGAVSLGYDGSHYSLAVVGTPEVITLGEQTASAVDLLGVGDYADTQEIISGAVTRNVGIYLITGNEEGWSRYNAYKYTLPISDLLTSYRTYPDVPRALLCTHFAEDSTSGTNRMWKQGTAGDRVFFEMHDLEEDSAETMKAWAAAQYAAGTPVIVIYPLAEQTTESVAGQPLHTHKGAENVITVTAEVSDISLTAVYKAYSGYTALSSLALDGSFWFKTGVVPASFDYEIECDAAFSNANTASPVAMWGFMGNQSSMPRWQMAGYSSQWLIAVNATTPGGTYDTSRHTFVAKVFEASGTAKYNASVDGTDIYQDTTIGSPSTFTANTWEIYIGGRNNNNVCGNKASGTFYSLKIRKAGAVVHHYIPVTRASDNAVGLYDYTTDSFIEKTAA